MESVAFNLGLIEILLLIMLGLLGVWVWVLLIPILCQIFGRHKVDFDLPEDYWDWQRPMPGAEDIERSYDPDMVMLYTIPDKYKEEE